MNTAQINWLKSLPNAEDDGSIQQILLRNDLQAIPFERVAQVLIVSLVNDKLTLQAENKKMSGILKEAGLYYKILE